MTGRMTKSTVSEFRVQDESLEAIHGKDDLCRKKSRSCGRTIWQIPILSHRDMKRDSGNDGKQSKSQETYLSSGVYRRESSRVRSIQSIELFEATGNAIPNRAIHTTAAKRRRPTMVWVAVRAYLHVPETGDVFAIPPPKWNIRLVVSGMRTPSGVANATSFPRVLGKTCGATGSNMG